MYPFDKKTKRLLGLASLVMLAGFTLQQYGAARLAAAEDGALRISAQHAQLERLAASVSAYEAAKGRIPWALDSEFYRESIDVTLRFGAKESARLNRFLRRTFAGDTVFVPDRFELTRDTGGVLSLRMSGEKLLAVRQEE